MSAVAKDEKYFQVEKYQVREKTNSTDEILSVRDIATEINKSINVPENDCVVTYLTNWLLEKLGCDLVMPGEKYYVLTANSKFYHLRILTGMELRNSNVLSAAECYENFIYHQVAKGIVFFDKDGNRLWKPIKSNYRFEAWVEVDEQIKASNKTITYKGRTFEKAEMPKILENELGKIEISYQKYDHEIASYVLLFNRKLKYLKESLKNNVIINLSKNTEINIFFENMVKGTFLVGNIEYTKLPGFLDPTLIKAICMQESRCGTDKNAKGDLMRVNVLGDWNSEKGRMGLVKGIVPQPNESIKYGITWLVAKGFSRSQYYARNVSWEEGGWNYDKVSLTDIFKTNDGNSADFLVYTWTECGWRNAVYRYNGNGTENYIEGVEAFYKKQHPFDISFYYKDDKNYISD